MRSTERTESPEVPVEQAEPGRTGVCVVGLGHVGLSLALGFDAAGDAVYGFDIDDEKVEALDEGIDPIGLYGDDAVAASEVSWGSTPEGVAAADFVIVAVPTPVRQGASDLSAVEAAARTVGERLRPGTTVILESTVPPGTTERRFTPAIEETSGLTVGEEFRVGYSPARLSPGDPDRGVRDVQKIVSGRTPETRDLVAALYERIVDPGVVRADDVRVAEAAKCLENAQRDLNIALANELSAIAHAMGIDADAVIDLAATKWNFHPYRPGIVAGACLPTDPYHLANAAERGGETADLIRTARSVNEDVPRRVVELTREAVRQRRRQPSVATDGGAATGERLLALGLAYKAGTGKPDDRGLAAVLDGLTDRFDVTGYDPRVGNETIDEIFHVPALEERDFDGFDVLLVGAAHPEFEDLDLATVAAEMNDAPVVVDVDDLFDRDGDVPEELIYRRL